MKKFKCEICDGSNLIKQNDMFVCQNCGTRYSIEDAKKLMVETNEVLPPAYIPDSVEVTLNDDKEISNLFELARTAKRENNAEKAAKYYEMLLLKLPQNWEANFYSVYFSSMACKVGEINFSMTNVVNKFETTLDILKEEITDEGDRETIITTITNQILSIAQLYSDVCISNYRQGAGSKIYFPEYMASIISIVDNVVRAAKMLDLSKVAYNNAFMTLVVGCDNILFNAYNKSIDGLTKSKIASKRKSVQSLITSSNPNYIPKSTPKNYAGLIILGIVIIYILTWLIFS